MIWLVAVALLVVSMVLLLVRAILGPGIFDRILVANVFGTNIVLLISVLALANGDESYIDISLVYALLNFVATIALLKYFKGNKA